VTCRRAGGRILQTCNCCRKRCPARPAARPLARSLSPLTAMAAAAAAPEVRAAAVRMALAGLPVGPAAAGFLGPAAPL